MEGHISNNLWSSQIEIHGYGFLKKRTQSCVNMGISCVNVSVGTTQEDLRQG